MISIGSLALANPDIADRLKRDEKLNVPDPSSFHGGDDHTGLHRLSITLA